MRRKSRNAHISSIEGRPDPALLSATTLGAEPITEKDRAALVQDLERSRAAFLAAIADVTTEAQWTYEPAPDRWSVAECAAHIIAESLQYAK